MVPAINHMTAPTASLSALLSIAGDCNCAGVELRNDLPAPLFDQMEAGAAAEAVQSRGMRVLALAEVGAFNRFTESTRKRADELAALALSLIHI